MCASVTTSTPRLSLKLELNGIRANSNIGILRGAIVMKFQATNMEGTSSFSS